MQAGLHVFQHLPSRQRGGVDRLPHLGSRKIGNPVGHTAQRLLRGGFRKAAHGVPRMKPANSGDERVGVALVKGTPALRSTPQKALAVPLRWYA